MALRPRLVVLRALGLGDLLTAVPALRALADAFPRHRRVLVTGGTVAPLAERFGFVDEVVASAPLAPLPTDLRRPDVAVNLHGRGPQSHRLLGALEPGRLIAFDCAAAGVTGPAWRPHEHEVARWCRLLDESGLPAEPGRLDLAVVPDAEGAGATVIHPGAAAAARRWPARRFADVARYEAERGRRVLVTGAPGERALATRVARQAGLGTDAVAAGRTDVVGLAALVAAAARVVCGDTGVAHLATAVGTPSVVLFGPTSPSLWGPPADRPVHRTLWCGRTGDPHGQVVDEGLLEIGVPQVLAALDSLPAHRPLAATAGGGAVA